MLYFVMSSSIINHLENIYLIFIEDERKKLHFLAFVHFIHNYVE